MVRSRADAEHLCNPLACRARFRPCGNCRHSTRHPLRLFSASTGILRSDTARAINDVIIQNIDPAYTLGANRRQVILKVLVPLAMPSVFNSLRLLFGLAFGYIMLAETIKLGGETGGLGDLINTSQRRGL